MRTLPLHVLLVAIDETSFWELKDWPEVEKVITTWLIDQNEVTYLCEITPSYALHPIDIYAIYKDPDFGQDGGPDEIRREAIESNLMFHRDYDVRYYHVHDIAHFEQKSFSPETVSFEDSPYDEQFEAWMEYVRGNQMI